MKFEGWCKCFSPIKSTETGAIKQRSLYWDLFNQNGMDFVTEISFCKTPLLMKNVAFIDRGWKSDREIIKLVLILY